MQPFPRLSRLPRLSPQIAGVTDTSGREWVIACWDGNKWRDCPPRLPGLHRMPPKNAEIAGVAGNDKDALICGQRLRRLRRIKSAETAETADIAGIAEVADIGKIVQIAKIVARECRDYRYCRPRMGDCTLRQKKDEVPDGINVTAETAAKKCRGCRGCWQCRECSYWQDYRDCRGCWECQFFSPRLPKVLTEIVEVAMEIAGRHCIDCRDCWECRGCRNFRDCRDCQDCHPTLPEWPTLPAENWRLHAETEKLDDVAGRD